MTDRERTVADGERWLEGYRRAWESNEADDIRAIFTDDAEYFADPWNPPSRGLDAIIQAWLDRLDEPGTWSFDGRVIAADGRLVFIQGETAYTSGTTYSNLWVVRLAEDGRASSFTEWWMDQTDPS
jgi:ketosteroid isomerase-like protein